MKKIISMVVLLSLFLSIPLAYSQTVTEGERQVYYKVVDRVASLSESEDSSEPILDRASREVAEENGLAIAEIDALENRVWQENLSEREKEIMDDLNDRISKLPEEHTTEEYNRVLREVASKYGISAAVLDDMFLRSLR